MKRLVLRMSALAAVLLLGWFTIAYAQRETDSPESQTRDTENWAVTPGQPGSQPKVATGATKLNPLRGTQGKIKLQEPSPPTYPRERSTSAAGTPPNSFGSQPATNYEPSGDRTQAVPTDFPSPPGNYPVNDRREPSHGTVRIDPNNPATPYQVETNRRDGSAARQPPQNVSPSGYDRRPGEVKMGPNAAQPGPPAPGHFDGESSSSPLSYYPGTPTSSAEPPVGRRETSGARYGSPNNSAVADHITRARRLEAAVGNEGTGRPASDRKLDGMQTPQLSIQKVAPKEIQVGKPAVFRIEVKNTGPVTAQDVEIRDVIPEGTRLIDTKPPASRGARGELIWTLGKIEPGSGASVEMQVMPTDEGEIGSVATVHFSASASTRTRATKPELVLNVTSPKTVMIEGQMTLSITVSNPGSGVASGVVLEEHVPACLQHPAGAELEYEIGDLAPNESKTLELKLTAVRPGRAANLLIVRADAVAEVKKELPIEVVAPKLAIEMSGPKNRYLERQATYELAVSNPGTAPARDVRLVAELPRGLKFVSTDHNGHYDPETRTVQWAVAELPAGETGTVQLTTLPVEIGQHRFQIRGTAEKALTVKEEKQVSVDGITAIRFEVRDVQDPIEVGGETIYEIRVLNQGSKEATQLCVAAALSPGLEVVAAEGPDSLGNRMQGEYLVFDPLPRLSPKVDVTYRIRVRGCQPGDQRISVRLTAAELQRPVTKEESTNVFSDK